MKAVQSLSNLLFVTGTFGVAMVQQSKIRAYSIAPPLANGQTTI